MLFRALSFQGGGAARIATISVIPGLWEAPHSIGRSGPSSARSSGSISGRAGSASAQVLANPVSRAHRLPHGVPECLTWIPGQGGNNRARHISTRQYARLVDEWMTAIGLRREDHGTHSLQRTKASIVHKVTGNLRAVQLLLGHTKIENTVRYLGVDVRDALALDEHTEV
jgi:hypothetical protein